MAVKDKIQNLSTVSVEKKDAVLLKRIAVEKGEKIYRTFKRIVEKEAKLLGLVK